MYTTLCFLHSDIVLYLLWEYDRTKNSIFSVEVWVWPMYIFVWAIHASVELFDSREDNSWTFLLHNVLEILIRAWISLNRYSHLSRQPNSKWGCFFNFISLWFLNRFRLTNGPQVNTRLESLPYINQFSESRFLWQWMSLSPSKLNCISCLCYWSTTSDRPVTEYPAGMKNSRSCVSDRACQVAVFILLTFSYYPSELHNEPAIHAQFWFHKFGQVVT